MNFQVIQKEMNGSKAVAVKEEAENGKKLFTAAKKKYLSQVKDYAKNIGSLFSQEAGVLEVEKAIDTLSDFIESQHIIMLSLAKSASPKKARGKNGGRKAKADNQEGALVAQVVSA